MIRHSIHLMFILSLTFVLSACVTAPHSNNNKDKAPREKPSSLRPVATPPSKVELKEALVEDVETIQAGSSGSVFNANCPKASERSWTKDNTKRITQKANTCVRDKNWERVEEMGQWLAQNESLMPWGMYYLSLSAEARRDYPRALWMIESASKKAPKEGILIYQLARLQWAMGDIEPALASLKQAVTLRSGLVDAHLILGQMALREGALGEANRQLALALQKEPRYLAAMLVLAEVRLQQKNIKNSLEILGQAVFYHPRSYRARARQAVVLEEYAKNFPEALASYRSLARLHKERRLDEAPTFDVGERIKSLEAQLPKSGMAQNLSQSQGVTNAAGGTP